MLHIGRLSNTVLFNTETSLFKVVEIWTTYMHLFIWLRVIFTTDELLIVYYKSETLYFLKHCVKIKTNLSYYSYIS